MLHAGTSARILTLPILTDGRERSASSQLILGGNTFGIAAPIVTGYMLSITGNSDSAFLLFGVLLSLTLTNRPIGAAAFETASPA